MSKISFKTQLYILLIMALVLFGIAWVRNPMKPLVRTSAVRVIYAEGEDFKDNGVAYRRDFRGNIFYVHLPDVRSSSPWWVVDFNNMMIYSAHPPHSFFLILYIYRKAPHGVQIDDRTMSGEWVWQFADGSVSFAGNGLTCRVRKARK